jgi:hypothetical protein
MRDLKLYKPASVSLLLGALLLGGCMPVFGHHFASEVSREKLLKMSEAEKNDHLKYLGSDARYHYVHSSGKTSAGNYKVRNDRIRLGLTFPVGEDEPYVLWPHIIEGKPLGAKPE